MDADNAPDIALAAGHARPGKRLSLPAGARWRQRPARSHRAAAGARADATQDARPPLRGRPPRQAGAPGAEAGTDATARADPLEEATSDGGMPGDGCAGSGSGDAVDIDVGVDAGLETQVDIDVDIGFGGDGDGDGDGDDDENEHALDRAKAPAIERTAPSASMLPSASTCDDVSAAVSGDREPGDDAAAGAADGSVADPATAAPQLASRDIELWLLARRTRGAALSLGFELRTALARQVFRRDFVYVSRQLHALEACRRVQGLDRARLNDALSTLRRRADEIQRLLDERAAELRTAIESRGPAGARIAFARPARFQATIVSPTAHRFLSLLMLADETLARLEMAWLLGLVDPAARSTLVSDCRRALLGFKDLACNQRHAMGMRVRDINAQRREGLAMPPIVD
ncbi:MAG TPA: hypothetical protein VIP05_21410 [Burkholderiaceae bacterium]